MKTKPKTLLFVSLVLLATAAGLPLQIMLLYGHPPTEVLAITAKLAPLNWAIFIMAPCVAWLVYQGSTFAIAAVPMLVYVVAANNWLVAELATNYSPQWAGLATVAFVLAMSPLLHRSAREILLHPERRWWLTPARRRAALPVIIENEGFEFVATTYDISEGGAFIPLWPIRPREPRAHLSSLQPGKCFTIFLDLRSSERIECRAEVVRYAAASGNYPDGIGIRFLDVGWRERRALAQYASGSLTPETPSSQQHAA